MLVSFFCSIYYNVILAWSCYYLYNSFKSSIPWVGCHHPWNTKNCFDELSKSNATMLGNESRPSPSKEFFMWVKQFNNIHLSHDIVSSPSVSLNFYLPLASVLSVSEFTLIFFSFLVLLLFLFVVLFGFGSVCLSFLFISVSFLFSIKHASPSIYINCSFHLSFWSHWSSVILSKWLFLCSLETTDCHLHW